MEWNHQLDDFAIFVQLCSAQISQVFHWRIHSLPCAMFVRDNFDELHQRLLRCYQSDILAMQEPTRSREGRLHQ